MGNTVYVVMVIVLVNMVFQVSPETTCYTCLHFELESKDPEVQGMLDSLNLRDPNCLADDKALSKEDTLTEVCEHQCYKETGEASLTYLQEHKVSLSVMGRGCSTESKAEKCTVGQLDHTHRRLKDLQAHFQELDLCYCETDLCNGASKVTVTLTWGLLIAGWILIVIYNKY